MTMILRPFTVGIVSAAAVVTSLGLSTSKASAQTKYDTYDFTADYTTSVVTQPTDRQDIITATITGENSSAPYGLNFFSSNTFGQLQPSTDPSILKYNFNADPGTFGLKPEPERISDSYYGGENELFGKANDSAEINLKEGTIKGAGTITITGGKGIFDNAIGTISFTQEDKLNAPGTPSVGLAKLTFSIKTPRKVPEPGTNAIGLGMVVIAGSLLLRRCRARVAS